MCIKMNSLKTIWYIIVCIFSTNAAKKLPSFVEQCYRGDDKAMSECLLRNIKSLNSRLPAGIPELSIPLLNPVVILSASVANDKAFKLDLTNIRLYNIHTANFKNVDMSFAKKQWELEVDVPFLNIETEYYMKGRLLVLELDSRGEGRGNLTGLSMKNIVHFDIVDKNGKEHLAIRTSTLKTSIKNVKFIFDNLFGNNKELNDGANMFLNENSNVLVDEFTPYIEKIINDFLKLIITNLYQRYPLDVLFPEK